jgi:hypothetical protein
MVGVAVQEGDSSPRSGDDGIINPILVCSLSHLEPSMEGLGMVEKSQGPHGSLTIFEAGTSWVLDNI